MRVPLAMKLLLLELFYGPALHTVQACKQNMGFACKIYCSVGHVGSEIGTFTSRICTSSIHVKTRGAPTSSKQICVQPHLLGGSRPAWMC